MHFQDHHKFLSGPMLSLFVTLSEGHLQKDDLLAYFISPFAPILYVQIDPSDLVKRGSFYFLYDRPPYFVMEDKTKRGLEVREHIIDEKYGVESDRGMIYDMDGIGHRVGIRWFFPKSKYSLEQVVERAEEIDKRYKAIREMTCPDD